ncbi:MAG: DUF1925 domain-containing protein [Bacteroides sp.]|nr:DUF1925 domain-containing protein [Prevotella sp.]MCM1407917.1 DUF1925 domain-containing protein [Treponema brennaborense]MCM1469659.1 DUF1925 domain-containing protein [Bacteroides sp.]
MHTVSFCFNLSFHAAETISNDEKEAIYQNSYKKLIKFLYTHLKCCFSLYFPGIFLDWLDKTHPEILIIVSELIKRGQIEIIGGGYYEPYFSLIQPADRVGQIELLTTAVRKITGKRPRGVMLVHSDWELPLVSCLKTCGMDYVLIDYQLMNQYGRQNTETMFQPGILEYLGKTIAVMPLHQEKYPNLDAPIESYIKDLSKLRDSSPLVCCSFSPEYMQQMIDSGWLERLCAAADTEAVCFTTPSRYLKTRCVFSKTEIEFGCTPELAQWMSEAYIPIIKRHNAPVAVKRFLSVYPEIAFLYARMMHTSRYVSQCKGDRVRKKAARLALWQAQNFAPFSYTGSGGAADSAVRRAAYCNLIRAEKLVTEAMGKSVFCSAVDFTMDGSKSYMFNYPEYTAFSSQKSGALFELDIPAAERNYCDAVRIKKTDCGSYVVFEGRLFADHLLEMQDLSALAEKNAICCQSSFAELLYAERFFDRHRREIRFSVENMFGNSKQPVLLKKNYTYTENGIQAQCILKNISSLPLKAYYALEMDFAIPYGAESKETQNIEVIAADALAHVSPKKLFVQENSVSHIRIADAENNVVFTLDPNEESGIVITSIENQLADNNAECETIGIVLFWALELEPNMETEKTLFLGINAGSKAGVLLHKKRAKKQPGEA